MEEEDQVLAKLGYIGAWQWKNIFITGLFCAPAASHVMIMTFMNAEVSGMVTYHHQRILKFSILFLRLTVGVPALTI